MTSFSIQLKHFLTNAPLRQLLDQSWTDETGYTDSTTGQTAATGICHYLLLYHLYLKLGEDEWPHHGERAEKLAQHLSRCVREDGRLTEPDGSVNEHPAAACSVADALGSFCHYGRSLSFDPAILEQAQAALVRLVEFHPAVRLPEGTVGRTQQMRFELRAYYWAWRVTGLTKYEAACRALWQNGIHAYQNPIALAGGLLQPSLHPDFTWNYTCSSGTTTEYATNTHTPVYYCTEPQGFMFVYAHGLKDGVFAPNAKWSEFCRKFSLGLLRNLSRAGHTSSDLDGYGIHRAWYSGCLLESVPVEALGLSGTVGLAPEVASWFRWYVEQYIEFVKATPEFLQTGLPGQLPYGHNITIEKQFPALLGVRFYAQLARAIYEYDLDTVAAVEPPPYGGYAWWHNWLRVSTPRYETSFAGTTSLCNIPAVRHFGDPNLGCLHGGSPLATLFVKNRLMFATSNDPEGLWHVELTDVNGNRYRSCCTSFADETAMAVRTSEGALLTQDSFESYGEPFYTKIDSNGLALTWSKNLPAEKIRFFVKNLYHADSLDMEWGAGFPKGLYIKSAAFILTVPQRMKPTLHFADGVQREATPALHRTELPETLTWSEGGSTVEVSLQLPPQAKACTRVVPVATQERSPGGENSFCPYALYQVRIELELDRSMDQIRLGTHITFL